MYLRYCLLFISFLLAGALYAQDDKKINPDGYNVFYYANGQKSAEGYLRNGKPDGYWKNYYENGQLKSEGRRVNFELDSTWIFYREDGTVLQKINYRNSRKNGYTYNYNEEGHLVSKVPYVNDTINGVVEEYYLEIPQVHFEKPYENNVLQGIGYEYGKDGRIISINKYEKGVMQSTMPINRYNRNNQKHGLWIWFYDDIKDEKVKRLEGRYKDGKKNGYFREYDRKGELLSTTKYVDGQVVENAEELMNVDIVREYYPNAAVRWEKTYIAGKPHGIWKEYNDTGAVINSKIYDKGILLGEGIVDESGLKQGPWKEYYKSGELRAEGSYKDGARIGKWKFHYRNGKLEQTGKYKEGGKPHGEWIWYYPNGQVLREEYYRRGLEDGEMIEYDSTGNIIARGSYIDGLQDGEWVYYEGDYKREGSYVEGMMHGEWTGTYLSNGKLAYKGKYVEDEPDGKHVWYYDNGRKMLEGKYVMGKKQGDWKRYDRQGNVIFSITYKDGKIVKIEGRKVKELNEE